MGRRVSRGDEIRVRGDTRIESVSASHSLPSGFLNTFSYILEGKTDDEYVSLGNLALDAHLMSTLEIEVSAGRMFVPGAESDSMAYILNESGARALGWEPDASSLGKTVEWTMGGMGFTAPVIGIACGGAVSGDSPASIDLSFTARIRKDLEPDGHLLVSSVIQTKSMIDDSPYSSSSDSACLLPGRMESP